MSTPSQASPRRLRVFLCHASADKQVVRELYQRLSACNVAPWLDEENLLPGQDWEREIRKAVRETDVVMVCFSRQSVTKAGFVQKEIKFALDVADEQPEGTIFIIPVRLEECEVPERLRRWHWFSYFEGQGYNRLMTALKERGMSLNEQIIPVDCQPNHHFAPSPPPLGYSLTSKQTGTSGQASSSSPYRDRTKSINRKKVFLPIIAVVLIAGLIGGIFLHNASTGKPKITLSPTPTASTSALTSTAIPTATATPTPCLVRCVLYHADWSKGLVGWMGGSQWSVNSDGILVSNGNDQNIKFLIAPYQPKTANYAVEAQIQFLKPRISSVDPTLFGVRLRGGEYADVNGYDFYIYNDSARIRVALDPDALVLETKPYHLDTSWHTYRIEANNTILTCYIDNVQVLQVSDYNHTQPGLVGLLDINSQINVRSFTVFS